MKGGAYGTDRPVRGYRYYARDCSRVGSVLEQGLYKALPSRYQGDKPFGDATLYLLMAGSNSLGHEVSSFQFTGELFQYLPHCFRPRVAL
jgi:hypothetical protein